jgi:RNA polymerase-binding transcription factor DksA
MPAAGQRHEAGWQAAPAAGDSLSTAIDAPESVTGADNSPDAVALTWDLTVHRLHRAFAECLAASPDATQGRSRPVDAATSPAHTGLAGVRLAATRHALEDIQDALSRMADGSYGTCERCGQPIAPEWLRAAPTTRWCPACRAEHRG